MDLTDAGCQTPRRLVQRGLLDRSLYTAALGLPRPREDSSILDFVDRSRTRKYRYIPVMCMRGQMLTL
jgi:hypothetical protein